MKTKECRYCSEHKPTSEFTKNMRTKDGYCSFCKSCLMGYRDYLRLEKCKLKLNEKKAEFVVENNEYKVSFE